MKKTAVLKKAILIALAVVTLSVLLVLASSAKVGEGFMNYGDIARTDYATLGLDGEKDEAYNAATPITIGYQSYNAKGEGLAWYPRENGEVPASGTAYILSDSKYLWVYVEVTDTTLNTHAPSAVEGKYTEDCVEILIDWTNNGFNVADDTPYQVRVSHEGYISARIGQQGTTLQGTEALGSQNPVTWFDGTAKYTENGYACEFKIDIPVYKYGDDIGDNISLCINVNDYDSTGALGSRIIISSDPVNGTNQWRVDKIGYAKLGFDAYSGPCGEDLTWSFDPETGVLNILGSGAMYDYEYDEAPWRTYYLEITSINISDGVTHIGAEAFYACNITSIVIPESVTSIGQGAFLLCSRLVEVINHSELPLEKGDYGNGCVGLYCLEIHDGESKIVDKNGFVFYTYEGVNYLCSYTGDDLIVNLPQNYNSENYVINANAFSEKKITDIVIPNTVTGIGKNAFFECTKLKTVEISNGVTHIGYGAFAHCMSITSIEIPQSVKSIDAYAFDICPNLDNIIINSFNAEIFDDEWTVTSGATITGYAGSTAEAYAEKYERNFVKIDSKVVFESKQNIVDDTFTVDVYFVNMPAVKSFAIKDFVYDTESVSLVSGKVNVEGVIADWDSEKNMATVTFNSVTDSNCAVLTLTFAVNEDAKQKMEISANTVVVKTRDSEGVEVDVSFEIEAGEIELLRYITGDVNGDKIVNTDDAIYLLRYTMLPNDYSINQSADMNGDGVGDSDDAIYLLRHILMPEKYPIE